ncbi:MAG TPA: chromosome segregation protein SMC [Cyanobacteria bacterium UBA8553]|nr:chromosome segregation protein SMC [Cyanobacteria bacterium UBA8553]HAJ62783.1 chromosome segregation protein SMC [Cyanobacteria bacterium UBA8543]
MLKSFSLKNFKAVRESKAVRFTPLTAFIGNNGSGKSSLIEGLATYQKIVTDGLDEAMNYWRGFEHIRNLAVSHTPKQSSVERPYETNPIEFHVLWQDWRSEIVVTVEPGGDELFIRKETLAISPKMMPKVVFERNENGKILLKDSGDSHIGQCLDGESIISSFSVREKSNIDLLENIARWQFVNLDPKAMGSPRPQKRTGGKISLTNDGSNIGEYLLSIYKLDKTAFDGIIETLQYVLPYARDIQPTLTSELERNVYLQLTESDFKVPGWLLSTGTLRIVALLALLRHPEPAPLIVIEEIENGLDPRSIHLIVEEIRNVVEAGKTQVILTTHSPYLLDLLSLSQIILVERDPTTAPGYHDTGQPVFNRPADQESLQEWSKKFGPGKLYTMNRLSQRG